MAKITDPDNLNQNTEIIFVPTARTIQLIETGNLSNDGVTLQSVYSFSKEEWKDDAELIKFPFPFIAITEEQFEIIQDWDWLDTTTKNLIRDGGWARRDSGNTIQEEYMNVVTLGSFDNPNKITGDTAYYQQVATGSSIDFVLSGPTNQAVLIFTNGGDNRRDFFRIFLREQGKGYDFGDLIVDQQVAALTFKKFAIPLSNSTDPKITATDTAITGTSPYTAITVSFFETIQNRTIGAGSFPFRIIVTGNSATAEQIYEKIQFLLRLDSTGDFGPADIDSGGLVPDGEDTDIVFRPDVAGDLGGTYFTFNGPSDVRQYYGWFNIVESGSTDPSPINFPPLIGIQINIQSGDTANEIALSAQTAMTANTNILNDFIATQASGTLTLTATNTGSTTDAADVTVGGVFDPTGNTTQGHNTTQIGKITTELLDFIGDTLRTRRSVYIDEFATVDTNRLEFTDDTGVVRTFPFVAAGVISFNDNLQNDVDAKYTMYFTNANNNLYGTTNAIIVNDNAGSGITDLISGRTSVSFDFDYDFNAQGGRTQATDANITLVAIGLNTAQFVSTTSTIGRNVANNITLVSALERNYENP